MTEPALPTRRWVAIDHPSWRQAHASSVLAVGGDLLAAWFAGAWEGSPDTRIWCARRPAGASRWSAPQIVASADEAHWNPVLAAGPDGALWLFFKRGPLISEWVTWVCRSADGGRTWSPSSELVPGDVGGRGPVKNPPLLLPDGTWLAPGSQESWGAEPVWESFVDVSTDAGATWRRAPIPLDRDALRGPGVIQPALWRDGSTVYALLRSSEGRAYRACSPDGGRTWSTAQPVGLPSNNSGLTVVALPDGSVGCVHNPVGDDWGARCPLVLSRSCDEGVSWREVLTIEDGRTPVDEDAARLPGPPDAAGIHPADGGVRTSGAGEYSYPAATSLGDTLVVTYTWQRRGIVEATVPIHSVIPEGPA
ncbi:exo-alpha-sialidase [Pseudonocardia sp. MH-G8]|uniref:sialidase family protein n=1 Tax=Pseudonocardia sp. MH-G8 TaxID=1854588 RepID=UPI000BA08853|nr:sialidase family protein [Pseudonocardia sp. MH-G8]OZM79580.1 neuraminidase (sialidase) [Pseudonocardia sp. MH-G8]